MLQRIRGYFVFLLLGFLLHGHTSASTIDTWDGDNSQILVCCSYFRGNILST